ncbi:NAD-dependent epimerase [Gammaproteobacteria bacterium]|nr:NAD-dependent epimerase [Gammaproteobacteria bacterium]
MKVLVTGAAGFIGFHSSVELLNRGDEVVGLDNLNNYYDVSLKKARLNQIYKTAQSSDGTFVFHEIDISNKDSIQELFRVEKFDKVINLAAQAGVRYSIENPDTYIKSNIVGFLNILEGCRYSEIQHLVYASSSSVYGANESLPFSVSDSVDHPLSLYAASKKANELMAHTYSSLYQLPTTGLRFFTVYGPWGRPDMALFTFTKAIIEGKSINLYNNGKHKRDFTYIDDIVTGIIACLDHTPKSDSGWNGKTPNPGTSFAPWKVYNIGNSNPVELMDYVETLERHLGRKANKRFLPLQQGDVPNTAANVDALIRDVNYSPNTPIEVGIKEFVEWYIDFYRVEPENL